MFSCVFMKILERRPRSYDWIMHRVSRGRVRAAKEAAAAEVPRGARVLEIGCGTGELAEILVSRGAKVHGFDCSPAMIVEARERIKRRGLEDQVVVLEMGVEAMDELPSAAFDAVVSTLVLSGLNPDERRFALKHARRVLRRGGLIVLADEVLPLTITRRMVHGVARAPLVVLTYLVASGVNRPIEDLAGDLVAAGFKVEKEERSHGEAFALVVARRAEREKRE